MADNQVIIGTFKDEAAADAAVESLKAWDQTYAEIKLSAIGVLVLDEAGQVKEHKLGARSGKKGAGIGLVLAVIAPPTLLAGIVGGGVLGHFHHQGLGLSTDDRERIIADLQGGKAAVGVLASFDEADAVSRKLTELGGVVEASPIDDEALEAVAAAVPVEPEAAPASA
jgi:hypothetical protein